MSILQALILGIVQGLTEFLPISSDGHLAIVPFIFGWPAPTLAFVVAVHIGTLAALLFSFREDVRALVGTVVGWKDAPEADRRLIRWLAVGTVPAFVAGVANAAFHFVEDADAKPVLVSLLFGVMGYVLLSSETKHAAREGDEREVADMTDRDAGVIGAAQAAALLPAISRSGMTISAGMRLGFSRVAATRFSFLLAIPAITGAVLFELKDIVGEGLSGSGPAMVVGIVTAGVTGFLAIGWLLNYVRRNDLRPFGTYLMLLMVTGFLTALARG